MKLDNLSAAKGSSKGEINLQWDSVKNVFNYVIEFSISSCSKNAGWKILDIISDSHYTVTNLKSNKIYLFRIAFRDEKGRTLSSDEIAKKAP